MMHTSGPWEIDGPMSGPRCAQALFWEKPDFRPAERIINISGRRYADCREAGPLVAVLPARDDNGDADANARLIAASPDLLEVAEKVRDKPKEALKIMEKNGFVIDNLEDRWQKLAFTFYTIIVESATIAEEAIAKAEGNTDHIPDTGKMVDILDTQHEKV